MSFNQAHINTLTHTQMYTIYTSHATQHLHLTQMYTIYTSHSTQHLHLTVYTASTPHTVRSRYASSATLKGSEENNTSSLSDPCLKNRHQLMPVSLPRVLVLLQTLSSVTGHGQLHVTDTEACAQPTTLKGFSGSNMWDTATAIVTDGKLQLKQQSRENCWKQHEV